MSDPIQFSVVVPLYNKEATLQRSLNSLAQQSKAALEVLVVDNGSTDGGPALAAAFGGTVQLLQIDERGVSQARNAGIAAATGNFVVFLDADDSWEPDFLAKLEALVQDFPKAGWYALGYAFKWGERIQKPHHPTLTTFTRGYVEQYFAAVAQGDMIATASSVGIPTKICRDMGGFAVGESIGEDQDLWARIALKYPVAFDAEVLAFYYQDANNMATKSRVQTTIWPFIPRIAALAVGHPQQATVERYLARQMVGQSSQLVLAKDFKAARALLRNPLAKLEGKRFIYWKLRAWLNL